MAMRYHVANAKLFLLAGVVAVLGLSIAGESVQATDTTVSTTVCNGSATGSLQLKISRPDSEIVVSSSSATLRGTVKNASQIVVEIDDAFNSVIPLGNSQVALARY